MVLGAGKSAAFAAAVGFVATLLAGAAPAARGDVLLADFEDGSTGGFQGWSNTVLSSPDPAPGSHGGSQFSLAAGMQQYWGQLPLPQWAGNHAVSYANVNANKKVQFDAYFPSSDWKANTADFRVGFYATIEGDKDAEFTYNVPIVKDQWTRFTIDYSALAPLTFNEAQQYNEPLIKIWIQPGYANGIWDSSSANYSGSGYATQYVFIDNVKLFGALTGDVNNDGAVNATDAGLIAADFASGKTGTVNNYGDLTGDGKVTADDWARFNLGVALSQSAPPAGAAVPEPGMLGTLLLGLPTALRRKRS